MLSCKPMKHRGITLTGFRRENDRLLLATLRDSEEVSTPGSIEIFPVSADIFRIRFTERERFVDSPSPSLITQSPFPEWTVDENPDAIVLKTSRLHLEICRSTCAFTWKRSDGSLIVAEPAEGGKVLRAKRVYRIVHDDDSAVVEERTVDGVKQRVSAGRPVDVRAGYSVSLKMAFAPDEALFGLGQHEEGILDYRYKTQTLYQTNQKVALPTLVSSRGYALHFDTHSLATFEGDEEGGTFWIETADQMDWWFVYGPEFDAIVAGLRRLTGAVPMLPRWAYGFFQSRERYETQRELIETAQRFRGLSVPLDGIILDWDSWPPGQWGQKSLDPDRFPDTEGLVRELHGLGVRLMVSIWPHLNEGGEDHREMAEAGYLLANNQTYDAFNEAARNLYWKQLREGLFDQGVDAWWCDCTEPIQADWQGSVKLTSWERMLLNTDEAKKYFDPALINAYSLFHTQGIYEGQRTVSKEKRVVILTRSAAPAQQRYGAITWSGDTAARWSRLKKQIADGLNFTVTGNPRWTCDIGAFFVKPGVQWFWDGLFPAGASDPGYRELYVRWFQLGTFLPMFRSHGTDTNREIWNFGSPGEVWYDTIKAFTELRYRLLPYIYSCAARESLENYTMLRNLAFDFRGDPQARSIDDQFMFGPAFLVCPVTFPMEWGPGSTRLAGVAKTRRVYLPAGTDWYDFWTGHKENGGRFIDAEAPVERMPLYVRAGSIVPLGPVVMNTDEGLHSEWEILVFPGTDSTCSIYEDAGDGYGYEDGEYCWTELRWDDARRSLSRGPTRGRYAGHTAARQFKVRVAGAEDGYAPPPGPPFP